MKEPSLQITFGPLKLPGPVVLASGTCGFGLEMQAFSDLSGLGGIVLKGVTLQPRPGNPPPRIAETASGLLNSIGLQNPGLVSFIEDILPSLGGLPAPLFANISGSCPEEYAAVVDKLDPELGLSAIEVNVSCPNRTGEAIIGTDRSAVEKVLHAVMECSRLPVLVKLSPEAGAALLDIAEAVEKTGAHGLTVANTFRGMSIDVGTGRPVLARGIGGLSGPAIKPLTLRMVYEVTGHVSIPVFACGGISTARDAVEFIMAGATAVQVGCAAMVDPTCPAMITRGIRNFLVERKLDGVDRISRVSVA